MLRGFDKISDCCFPACLVSTLPFPLIPGCIPCQLYAEGPPGHLFRYAENKKAVSKTVNIVGLDKEN